MENCIFCELINENDPIKIPEQGKDYSIIKGMFIEGCLPCIRRERSYRRSRWVNRYWITTGTPRTDRYPKNQVSARSGRSDGFSSMISSSGRPVGNVPADL